MFDLDRITDWQKQKGIDKSTLDKQFIKLVEEVGEIATALARIKEDPSQIDDLLDGCADTIVVAVGLINLTGVDPHTILSNTLTELEGRTGKVVDGIFIKDND